LLQSAVVGAVRCGDLIAGIVVIEVVDAAVLAHERRHGRVGFPGPGDAFEWCFCCRSCSHPTPGRWPSSANATGPRAGSKKPIDIDSHPDRFDAAASEARYREALALAEPRSMRPLVAYCLLGLGKLYRRTGKRGPAQEHLTTATTMYREMGMTYWLEKAQAQLE
jgi:hypothetical protein